MTDEENKFVNMMAKDIDKDNLVESSSKLLKKTADSVIDGIQSDQLQQSKVASSVADKLEDNIRGLNDAFSRNMGSADMMIDLGMLTRIVQQHNNKLQN